MLEFKDLPEKKWSARTENLLNKSVVKRWIEVGNTLDLTRTELIEMLVGFVKGLLIDMLKVKEKEDVGI